MLEQAIKMYFEDIRNYSEIMRKFKVKYPCLKCLFDMHKQRLKEDVLAWKKYKERVLKIGYITGRIWDEDE